MTDYQVVYEAFFDRIEKDTSFFSYNNLNEEETWELAKSRADAYMHEAMSIINLNCVLDVDIQFQDDIGKFNIDLTSKEIYLIGSIMYEIYLSRDIALLKTTINALTSADIKMLYSPSQERNSFINMFKSVQDENKLLIDKYNSRDRLTGKLKSIDYVTNGI